MQEKFSCHPNSPIFCARGIVTDGRTWYNRKLKINFHERTVFHDHTGLPDPLPHADFSLLFPPAPGAVPARYDLCLFHLAGGSGVSADLAHSDVPLAAGQALQCVLHRDGDRPHRVCHPLDPVFRRVLLGPHLRHPRRGGYPPRPLRAHAGAGLRLLRQEPHRPAHEPPDNRPL